MARHVVAHASFPPAPGEPADQALVANIAGRWGMWSGDVGEWVPQPAGGPALNPTQATASSPHMPGFDTLLPQSIVENVLVEDDLMISLPVPAAGQDGVAHEYTVVVQQDGTGGHAVTLDNVVAAGGVHPTFSTAANVCDVVRLAWTGYVTGWVVLWHLADVQVV